MVREGDVYTILEHAMAVGLLAHGTAPATLLCICALHGPTSRRPHYCGKGDRYYNDQSTHCMFRWCGQTPPTIGHHCQDIQWIPMTPAQAWSSPGPSPRQMSWPIHQPGDCPRHLQGSGPGLLAPGGCTCALLVGGLDCPQSNT